MAITAEQMLLTRSQNQLFIQQKVPFHGCDVGRLGWETSAQPGMLARGRLGPGALTMLIKTCDKFMSSAQTADCPGAHPGPRRLLCSSPSAPALTIPARFGHGSTEDPAPPDMGLAGGSAPGNSQNA